MDEMMTGQAGMGGDSDSSETENQSGGDYGKQAEASRVTTDIALIQGKNVKEGDVFPVRAVKIDEDMGSVTIECVRNKEQEKPPGIDQMAEKFNQPPEEQA